MVRKKAKKQKAAKQCVVVPVGKKIKFVWKKGAARRKKKSAAKRRMK